MVVINRQPVTKKGVSQTPVCERPALVCETLASSVSFACVCAGTGAGGSSNGKSSRKRGSRSAGSSGSGCCCCHTSFVTTRALLYSTTHYSFHARRSRASPCSTTRCFAMGDQQQQQAHWQLVTPGGSTQSVLKGKLCVFSWFLHFYVSRLFAYCAWCVFPMCVHF